MELGSRYEVERKVRRGKPRQLTVVYEVLKTPMIRWAGPRSLFAYQTKQGLTIFANIHANMDLGEKDFRVGTEPIPTPSPLVFRLGFGTNGDDLVERYKGYILQLDKHNIVTERLAARFELTAFGSKWKSQTILAAQQSLGPVIYRSRLGIEPALAFAITPDLFVTAGFNLTSLEMQLPLGPDRTVKAGVGGVHYQKTAKSGSLTQRGGVSYTLRTAGRSLDADFIYTRHYLDGFYFYRRPGAMFRFTGSGGRLTGDAPMFERFSIGSTVTARGFNKYDLAPLGATRMSHASVEVGVSAVRLFYDAGSVWDPGQPMVVRNSLGLTFGAGDQRGEGFLTIAAAIRNSRLEPTIMFRLWGR
jgi:hypothetical protein